MAFTRISNTDLTGKQVSELQDIPEMSTADLKARFDMVSKDVIIPKHNTLVDELEAESASNNIGVEVPEGIVSEKKLGPLIKRIASILLDADKAKHSHENKSVLDAIIDTEKKAYDRLVALFKNITSVSDTVSDDSAILPTGKAIVAYVKKLGAGDMLAAIYDKDGNGVVDNAEKLGGELPKAYQKVIEATLQTASKTIPGAINELFNRKVEVIDNLLSTVIDLPLSANQGRVLDKKIEEVYKRVVSNESKFPQMKTLWTNPDKTAIFGAQPIIVEDLSKFDIIGVEYCLTTSFPEEVSTAFASFSSGGITCALVGVSNQGTRKATFTDNKTITFDVGKYGGSTNNNAGIPYKIYGIKFA